MSKLTDQIICDTCTIKDAMKAIDNTEKKTVFIVNENNELIGSINDGEIRRAMLSGLSEEDPIIVCANLDVITDPEVAKERMKGTGSGYMLLPVVDKNNKIIDLTVVTSYGCKPEKDVKSYRRVLVIGGAGYVGSVLCRKLLDKGYRVRVLDSLIYGDIGIRELYKHPKFELRRGDMRDLQLLVKTLRGIDAVIHLAAIVGDPASDLKPQETIETNFLSTKMIADVCKFSQINRLVFASTCSVYGASKDKEFLTEESDLNPVSLYAKIKLKSEKAILDIADDNFRPIIIRMATLHGLSPRMRFDLVVNILSVNAVFNKHFLIFGGKQRRALCHVSDACDSFIACIELPLEKVGSQIFNIATENMSILELGEKVKKLIPGSDYSIKKGDDLRDYVVSSKKATSIPSLPILTKKKTVNDTIDEINSSGKKFLDFKNKIYSNVNYLKDTK